MPTILRSGPYRVYFTSHDRGEPPHVHVDREKFSAKFWLGPIRLSYNLGYPARELRMIEKLLSDHETELEEEWNAYFST
jgi:hypothetical protein